MQPLIEELKADIAEVNNSLRDGEHRVRYNMSMCRGQYLIQRVSLGARDLNEPEWAIVSVAPERLEKMLEKMSIRGSIKHMFLYDIMDSLIKEAQQAG